VRSKVTGPPRLDFPAVSPQPRRIARREFTRRTRGSVGELCPGWACEVPGYFCVKPLDFGLAFPLPRAVTSSCSQRPCSLAGPPRPLAAGAKTDTEHSRVSSNRTGFLRTLRAGVRIAAAPAERGHKDIEIESPFGRTEGRTTKREIYECRTWTPLRWRREKQTAAGTSSAQLQRFSRSRSPAT
jgi:hypothetical protein